MEKNEMMVIFDSSSENESFARMVIAAFVSRIDPTLEELADIKTAVSEAVTNSIIHGYKDGKGDIRMHASIADRELFVEIEDACAWWSIADRCRRRCSRRSRLPRR